MRRWFAVLMIAGLSSVSVVADEFEPLPPVEGSVAKVTIPPQSGRVYAMPGGVG